MSLTDWFCIGVIVVSLIYDLIVVLKYGKEATITASVQKYSKRWPLIPFLLGVLVGHWFW